MWKLDTYLKNIPNDVKKKFLCDIKKGLSEELQKKYKDKKISLKHSSYNDIDESIKILHKEKDLPENSIQDLFLECVENNKMKIRFFKIPQERLPEVDFDRLISTIGNESALNFYENSQKIPAPRGVGLVLTYIRKVNENELRFVYRWSYIYTKKTSDGYIEEKRVTPVCIVINTGTGLAQARICAAPGVQYSEVWSPLEDELKSMLNVEIINKYPLIDTINHLFNSELLTKFEGRHKFKQVLTNNIVCDAVVSIKVNSLKDDIDYVNLPVFDVIRKQRYTAAIEIIKGIWNETNENVSKIFGSSKKIHFDAVNHEILLKGNYMEKEVEYVLSQIQ